MATAIVDEVSHDKNEGENSHMKVEDKLFEEDDNLFINIKEEALSPKENDVDSEELENVSNNETNFEPMEKVICIKKEVLDEEINEDPLIEDSMPLHEEMCIKEEPIHVDTNPTCFKQRFDVVREKSVREETKKFYKRSPFSFSSDCSDVLPRKKVKRKNFSEADQLMQSAMEGLQILQNHLARPPEDHIEMFMHYIVSELREIKSPVNLIEAKQSIFNVVYDLRKRELQ